MVTEAWNGISQPIYAVKLTFLLQSELGCIDSTIQGNSGDNSHHSEIGIVVICLVSWFPTMFLKWALLL